MAVVSCASLRILARSLGTIRARFSRRFATKVPLTSEQYPQLTRGNFARLSSEDIGKFQTILGESRVVEDEGELVGPNQDWLGICRGASKLLLKPRTTAEVSAILAYCNSRRIAVVPQSGNTSLVAGATPVFDEVILSMSLMNQVISLDKVSGILVCQAGCILEKLDGYLSENGFMMPLDLGAKGSCMIGGNISTNAGGLRLLRYGSLHGNLLGVEAVLADGTIIDCLSTNRKDNTGYDIKHLFVGSEGTLGVVTAASLITPYLPRSINVAFFSCSSYKEVLAIFKAAKSMLGEVLSAFEMVDHGCIEVVDQQLGLHCPVENNQFYVLVETSGSDAGHDEDKLLQFSEWLMTEGLIQDGTIAADKQKISHLWKLRESISEALLHMGYVFKYDVSIPLPKLYKLVEIIRDRLADKVLSVVGYGHIGDGNLHLNVVTDGYNKDVHHELEPYIFEWVRDCSGSISAEHGIGFKKAKYLHYAKSPQSIETMNNLKTLFDPNGILNPYKCVSLM